MKMFWIVLTLFLLSCATSEIFYSRPEDSSRKTNEKYTEIKIDTKIEFNELDQNLSRFYVAPNTPHLAAIPITGILIDSIAFFETRNSNNKKEYRTVAEHYKAFLFNKVSCFYTFSKGTDNQVDLSNYNISIANIPGQEHNAGAKNEQEYVAFLTLLNGVFPKTYDVGKSRSIETNSLYSQDLVCGDKIDFEKPFFIQFKSKTDDKTTIELSWL